MLFIIVIITCNMNSLSVSLKTSLQKIRTINSTIDKDKDRDRYLNLILQGIENIETLKIKGSSAHEKMMFLCLKLSLLMMINLLMNLNAA